MTLRSLAAAAALVALCGALASAQPADTKHQPKTTAPAKAEPPKDAPKGDKAAAAKLKVGDKAPALKVEKWVKGEPVTGFEKGKVYVVEFWATWCGPCIAGMPHLSEVQKEYKDDVTVIGVTSKDNRGNTLEAVEKMVKAKGDTMAYTVAWDTDRKTTEAFRDAAGIGTIPCAFIVDRDGKIAYIGHPGQMDDALAKAVGGKHDHDHKHDKHDHKDEPKKDAPKADKPAPKKN